MIDLEHEKPIALSDVPKLSIIPRRRGSGRLNTATVYRWAQRGLRGVRLEVLQFGGVKVTTLPALQRFFERLGGESVQPVSTSKRIEKEHTSAERRLDAIGI